MQPALNHSEATADCNLKHGRCEVRTGDKPSLLNHIVKMHLHRRVKAAPAR